jgi:aspartyl-tRNA(Asn)/glutamyl-tRNA(Gln) amidotransferase subunit A
MSDLLDLNAVAAREALDKKAISAVELATAYLGAAEATAGLNNYVVLTADHALAMAANADKRIADGTAGLLEGLPIGVKDLFCTKGVSSTACSNILKGFTPPYESTVTANLWAAGGVMLGKLNCDEFAMGSGNETSAFGPAINPWRIHSPASGILRCRRAKADIWPLFALGHCCFCLVARSGRTVHPHGGRQCADDDGDGEP